MAYCDCVLEMKLFIISLATILEGSYQAVLMKELLFPWFYDSEHCNLTEVKLKRVLALYVYIYDPSFCGEKTVSEYIKPGAEQDFTEIESNFTKKLNDLGTMPVTPLPFLVIFCFVTWQVLDYLLIIWSVALFCLCYCASLLKRNACYYIIFPWLILVALVIVFDIASISFACYLISQSLSTESWMLLIGYTKKQSKGFGQFDQFFKNSSDEHLTYFPKRILYISCRHGFAIPMFIAFFIMMISTSWKIIYAPEKLRFKI